MTGDGILLPNVPVSVWDQMGVVVLYTLLLIIIGGLLIRQFTNSVAHIEEQHTVVVRGLSEQYIEAIRIFNLHSQEQSSAMGRMITQLDAMGRAIERVDASVQQLHEQQSSNGSTSTPARTRAKRG